VQQFLVPTLLAGLLLSTVDHVAAQQPAAVIIARVATVELSDPIEALGTLRANETAVLTSTVTETISDIRFSDGQRVEAGQVLVTMTNREQLAELAAAEAEMQEARRQFGRVQELAQRGQEARALLDQRQRELDTARARLSAIEARLSDRLIAAPFDGVVGLRTVSVGSLLSPGTPVTTLIDDSVMKLDFPVPELHLAQVRPGLVVRARSRAFPEREFEGRVASLSNLVDPVTRAFQVRAELPNPGLDLRPGMLMSVTLQGAPRTARMIPEEGLQTRGREHFVYRVELDPSAAMIARRITVSIGARIPGQVEITAGLDSDDRVVIHGGFRLDDGDLVRIQAEIGDGRGLSEILAEIGG